MKVDYLIDTVDKLVPNEFDKEDKIRWINQIETEIYETVVSKYKENYELVCYEKVYGTSVNGSRKVSWNKISFTKNVTEDGIIYTDSEGNVISPDSDEYNFVYQPVAFNGVTGSSTLLAPDMFSEMYVQWIVANIYLSREETTKYNNAVNIYNQQLYDFRSWYSRTHRKINNSIFNFVAWGDV